MKKLLLISLTFLLATISFAQKNIKQKALLANVGLEAQNLNNRFNSPITYSGIGFSGSLGYISTDYNKSYQEVRLSASIASLMPIYINPTNYNPKDVFVSSINAELQYRYTHKVCDFSEKFKLYVGGSAMIDFGLRNNNALGNGSTDINLSLMSLGASAGMSYKLNQRMNFGFFLDLPLLSFIYCTHYLGGIAVDEKLEFRIASLGSYQKIATDLFWEFFLKNGNGFRLSYDFSVINNTNNQKITIGEHVVYFGFLFNLSKPRQ